MNFSNIPKKGLKLRVYNISYSCYVMYYYTMAKVRLSSLVQAHLVKVSFLFSI